MPDIDEAAEKFFADGLEGGALDIETVRSPKFRQLLWKFWVAARQEGAREQREKDLKKLEALVNEIVASAIRKEPL